MENKIYYVYFLESLRNGKIYVGSTEKDPKERSKEHNHGSNKWTKENKPFALLYYEKYYCKKDAQERERFYKTGFGRLVRDSIIRAIKELKQKTRDSVSAIGRPVY